MPFSDAVCPRRAFLLEKSLLFLEVSYLIGFIGAGQVGITLGSYFVEHGIGIVGYYSRSFESANRGAAMTKSRAFKRIEELVQSAKYIIVTTPDDVIEKIANQLTKCGCEWKSKVICHTSGAHPSTLFEPLIHLGATTASLHPMLSFANMDDALETLSQTPLTLEGKGILMDDFKKILEEVHLNIYEIRTEQKSLYHAAACIVSNYLVTLMDIGIESLVRAGFESNTAAELIAPLATGTLQNYLKNGSVRALTGPLTRGDVGTIIAHIKAISKEDKILEDVYRIMGRRTLKIVSKQNRLDEYTLDRLKEVLQSEEESDYRNNKKNEEEK